MSEAHVNGTPVNEVEADEVQSGGNRDGTDMELRRRRA